MKKTLNFDNFLSEKNHDTITVTVFGKDYEVANEIPAIVPLMMARAEEGDDGKLSDATQTMLIFKAMDALFGKENADEICRKGLSSTDMANLIGKVFAVIQGTDTDEEEGEEFDDVTGKRTVKKAPKE